MDFADSRTGPSCGLKIVADMSQVLAGHSQIEAAVSSPNGHHLAVCLQTKNWLGLVVLKRACYTESEIGMRLAGSFLASAGPEDGS